MIHETINNTNCIYDLLRVSSCLSMPHAPIQGNGFTSKPTFARVLTVKQ